MNVLRDDWTPLFDDLESRLSVEGRRKLLFQLIGDVYDVTVLNFGDTGEARPEEWQMLTANYAEEYHDGNQTPTLILSGALRAGFVHEVTSEYATLTNVVEYADEHQFGVKYKKLPARPFYPVDDDGLTFTPYMVNRLAEIVEEHFTASPKT